MGEKMRQQIAEEAARLMLENGETSFNIAKRKAAEKKGLGPEDDLPSNQEIEAQIKLRQTLFDGEAHINLIRDKRQNALSAMGFFKGFSPMLTGPVMDGTASRYSPIEIHLFADAVEEVTIFLMENKIPFQIIDRRLRMGKNEEMQVPVLSFYADEQLMEVSVFPPKFRNHSPLSQVDGSPQKRMNIKKLQKLLSNEVQ